MSATLALNATRPLATLLTAPADGGPHTHPAPGRSMRDHSCLKTMEGHEGRIMCGDLSDDGKYFATAAMDRTWKLWAADMS